MRRLDQHDFAPVYDSNTNIKEFYDTALACAKKYQRVSAYFDARLFPYLSKGIKQLLLNNGHMQLVLSTDINNKKLIDEIAKGYKAREAFNGYKLDINELIESSEDFASLAFLIKIGKLDIKIAQMEKGIFHEKYGLITDKVGNTILFSGSNNETQAAINYNFESFETTMSWDASRHEIAKIDHRKKSFKSLWNDENPKTDVWDADAFFKLFNYDDIEIVEKKIVEKIGEKIIVIQYSDENNRLILKGHNFDIDSVFNSIKGKKFQRLYEKKNNKVEFKPNLSIVDIDSIYSFLLTMKDRYGFITVTTKEFDKYYDAKKLDMDRMSSDGKRIKSPEFYDTEEFKGFHDKVNSLISRPLREAQSMAAYHLVTLRRTMNFSVPGSGKTASVLGAYIYLRDYLDSVDRLFVIGPISSFKAWREEYKILYPGYSKYEIFDSGEEKDTLTRVEILKSDFNKFNLILINYEAVPLVDNILSQLISHRTMIVFDEIHRIKRIEGKQFNATYKIAENASYRTALTGTPLPNGYKDLHNLFKILYDEYSYSYFGFSSDYLNDIQKRFDNMQIEDKELNSKINPFFVRLSKNDLGVPPANPDNLYWIEPSREEKITYQNIFYDDNKTMFSKTISLIQVGLLSNYAKNVEQIDHEQFTNDDSNLQKEPDTIPDDLSTSKADAIVKLVNDLISQGKSVVIWAVFIKSILVLDKALKKQGIDVRLIYGNIGIQSRDKIINDFNNGKFQVLLTNPSTLAESVSLHKVCHDAIYVEMNFNLAQYLQSRDRIHRLGLSEDVETNYHIFINKYEQPSIDEKIYDRLKEKEKQMYTAINEGKLFTQENVNISDFNSMFDKGR